MIKQNPISTLLNFDRTTFNEKFNKTGFMMSHQLVDHELFTLPRIVELSKRLPEANVEYNAGDLDVGHYHSETPGTGLSIEETIQGIETANSWMVLKNVEIDEEYGALLNECLAEVAEFSEPIAPGMRQKMGFVFVSSPGSITPFHIDHENNFLLQIRGNKHVRMFNRNDRTVLPAQSLERFFGGGHRNLQFSDEYLDRSEEYTLTPGEGLHFPVNAPHFVRNADNVSISFSITFQTEESERNRALYVINHRLRKLRLSPSDPGTSGWKDAAKFGAYKALRSVKRLMGK